MVLIFDLTKECPAGLYYNAAINACDNPASVPGCTGL